MKNLPFTNVQGDVPSFSQLNATHAGPISCACPQKKRSFSYIQTARMTISTTRVLFFTNISQGPLPKGYR